MHPPGMQARASAITNLAINAIAVVVVLFWNFTFEHDYR